MWTGNPDMAIAQQHIPRSRAILEEGDLLYNPDWMWHKVTSMHSLLLPFLWMFIHSIFVMPDCILDFGGLSIGVPIRETNVTLSIRNNPFFMSIAASNVFSAKLSAATGLNLNVGGFPDAITSSTEQDN